MTGCLLLCTDLDRTLLPNGAAPESPGVRERFRILADDPRVRLAYVSGRDPVLVDDAIRTWAIPIPDLLIADVGSTLAFPDEGGWRRWQDWDRVLSADWSGRSSGELADLLDGVSGLDLQEPARQSRFKRSYHTEAASDEPEAVDGVRRRLERAGLAATVIWSLDENLDTGLLDILPASASKLLALEFVLQSWNWSRHDVLFAGDSGNDLDVLASPIPSVLVANARSEVRDKALRLAQAGGNSAALYCARGGKPGMNGNYAAGILEGVLHYHPGLAPVIGIPA